MGASSGDRDPALTSRTLVEAQPISRMVEQEIRSRGKKLVERQPGIPNVSVKLLNFADNDGSGRSEQSYTEMSPVGSIETTRTASGPSGVGADKSWPSGFYPPRIEFLEMTRTKDWYRSALTEYCAVRQIG